MQCGRVKIIIPQLTKKILKEKVLKDSNSYNI